MTINKFNKNLILALFSLAIGLTIAEMIVRAFIPVRNVGPSFTEYDPVYGKSLKKNFTAKRMTPEFRMEISTNSHGFRGSEIDHKFSRSIMFLGDSFTMGYGVNNGEEYPDLIRQALNENDSYDITIINAGMGGNGNGRALKFLRREGKSLNPSLIVLQIHENDFRDNVRENLFDISPTGELVELPVPEPDSKRIIQSVVENVPGLVNSYLVGLLRQVTWRDRPASLHHTFNDQAQNDAKSALEEKLTFRILQEIVSLSRSNGWQLLPVLVNISDRRLAIFQKFHSDNNLPVVTIQGKWDNPDLYYNVDGHWNAAGHRYTADQVLELLKGSLLINEKIFGNRLNTVKK